ncbi:unnamed protein product [Sphagnum jensenii]|uniref:Phosphatidic acid phosphatase type 2/haloperoxidase domain-containing protein n=1 Tax=Sphagnum jensenii TaxID=128206 RepID=A0ABP1APJ4_9BRYO
MAMKLSANLVFMCMLVCLSSCMCNVMATELVVDNVITQWNSVTQQVVRTLEIPNQIAIRVFSFVHLSQYKALQLAYKKRISHPEISAAYAAHYVLSELFPTQQSPIFDGALNKQVTPLKLSKSQNAEALDIGLTFAIRLLRQRTYDGSQSWADFHPAPVGAPTGEYQFTPNQTYVLYPQLAYTKGFVINSSKDFDIFGGPFKIPSKEYDLEYNQIATVGNANSLNQTSFDKATAKFWEAGSNTSQIVSQLYNVSLVIAGPHLSLKEVAELFAKLAIAGYDSSILGWYQKFKYLYWRPITALRQGDPTHKPDPTFATVLATPPHPEYPSLHSSNAGSWGIVLAKFLGISITEKIKPFIVNTEGYFLPPRTYNTINDVLVEIGISRVYGGIHFQKSVLDGTQLGIKAGEYVLDRFEEVFGTI